ncbi:hypothetical protein ElyMa_006140700 [Elysia marginata]|uniref:Uncharacterized protein n=1 Tax=Elysia marginata TaxID=1093978 RepID=A0AAV4GXN5_9GAST|nr:hypothetical protein ElyMa_006140700 [Elysia marginata]
MEPLAPDGTETKIGDVHKPTLSWLQSSMISQTLQTPRYSYKLDLTVTPKHSTQDALLPPNQACHTQAVRPTRCKHPQYRYASYNCKKARMVTLKSPLSN